MSSIILLICSRGDRRDPNPTNLLISLVERFCFYHLNVQEH